MPQHDSPNAVFVYGTLKRGEVRARLWPHAPLRIEMGMTRGLLYDLGRYPAMIAGPGWVRGEVWFLADCDVRATLRDLDRIEGYGQSDTDLFVRQVVECLMDDGRTERAHAYFLAQADLLQSARQVVPDAAGVASWQRHGAPDRHGRASRS